jgi:hypothetical protein
MKAKKDKMTIEEYRQALRIEFGSGEKIFSPLCNDVLYILETNAVQMSIRDIWNCFEDISISDIRIALTWLIMVGKVIIDPSLRRHRKYGVDPDHLTQKKKEIESQKSKKSNARDSILALDPTVINEEVARVLDEEIARLSAVKTASQMNLNNDNDLMISIQDKHVVVILTPKERPYQSIREFLGRLDTMAQLDESLFFDLEDTESMDR